MYKLFHGTYIFLSNNTGKSLKNNKQSPKKFYLWIASKHKEKTLRAKNPECSSNFLVYYDCNKKLMNLLGLQIFS